MVSPARIVAIGTAHPPAVPQEELWKGFFERHYSGVARGLAKRVFEHSGVNTRHAVINPLVEDPSRWPTSVRMERFLAEALPLAKDAVTAALDRADVAAADLGMLVVCSCTGYVTPGLDILLARDLALPADARRVFVGHMGCYAALPGLSVAADYVALNDRPAALLCIELPSLHVQPPTADPQQVVAHALFSDAAAAVVLVPGSGGGPQPGLGVTNVGSLTDTTTADHMTWHVTDLGFRMGLSPRVPDVLAHYVGPLVDGLLERNGQAVADVTGWAIHPGGPRILEVVQEQLGLTDHDLALSKAGLAEHGNCSSPTVLLILERLLHDPAAVAGPVVMMAFGPGLTLYAGLLHA